MINPQDLIVYPWTYESRGGFSREPINGIKVHHKPSGIEAFCERFKSKHRNRAECIKLIEEELCHRQMEKPNNTLNDTERFMAYSEIFIGKPDHTLSSSDKAVLLGRMIILKLTGEN